MVQNTQSVIITDESASRTSLSDLEDSPLNGDEKLTYVRRKRNWSIPWLPNDSPVWKYWSLAASSCSIILLATTLFYKNSHSDIACKSLQSNSPPLMGYPHPVETWKKENLIETKFYRDLRYMTLDHESDYLWKEHLFMSTGNIRVPDGNGNSSLMSISMYHQMHCLAKLRLALQQAREGVDIGVDWRDDAHWPHCFDYMRSSILCFADGTLERVTAQPGPVEGTVVKVIDGGVETRYCRDTRPLNELERKYGPNSQYGQDAANDFEVAPGR